LLDDSSTARRIIKEALVQMGFSVIEGSDGEQGLQILEELYDLHGDSLSSKLRLIASDIEMPRMDGFHFAAKVKEDSRFKMIPIVFNSSISDHFSDIRGKEAGAEAYLVKFDENLFFDEIARVVQSHM
jgi:two-component system chemotaxis response regulator CheV